jgi:hypothetical protein
VTVVGGDGAIPIGDHSRIACLRDVVRSKKYLKTSALLQSFEFVKRLSKLRIHQLFIDHYCSLRGLNQEVNMHAIVQSVIAPVSSPRRLRRTYNANPLKKCDWLDFTVIHDARGNLSVIENFKHIPFEMKRVFFLYDIPAMAERAGHAHYGLVQVFISMSGSFDLHLDDGVEKRTVHLCRANRGYLVQPWTWGKLDNFSGSSVCLVVASQLYDETDYIRSYADFQRLAAQRTSLYK